MNRNIEFVQHESEKPFEWAVTDCCATAFRWVETVSGRHPLDAYGRRYHSEAEARLWIEAAGSLLRLVRTILAAAGLKKTGRPVPGDVGIVQFEGRVFLAILTPNGWFSRDFDGLIMAPANAFRVAWRVEGWR